MSRVQTYREAFERELWAGALGAYAPGWPCRKESSEEALIEALRRYWGAGDPHALLAVGRRLEALGPIGNSIVSRLRLSLLRLGCFAQAVALSDRRPAAASDSRGIFERAWALAGVGRIAEARAALAQAPELADDYAAPLSELLKAESDPLGPEDWPSARRLVRDALSLGLGALAARQLAGALAAGGLDPMLGLEEDELEDAVDLARAAMRLCGPAEAPLLLDALGPLYAEGQERAAFWAVRDGLAGDGDSGADMEDSGDPRRAALHYLLALACSAAGRRRIAIRRLGRLTLGADANRDALCDLARDVARETLAGFEMTFAAPAGARKVVDVFPYNGELALLEIKLHQMSPWVDRFVLVEAATGFDGRPKPLAFEAHRARLGKLADKVEHVVVEEFPEHLDTPAARAFYQRDQGIKALSGFLAPEDLVLISNVGEVLDGAVVAGFDGRMGLFRLQTFAYFLNLRLSREQDRSSPCVAVQARFLAGSGMGYLRAGLHAYSKAWTEDAGWRFTRVYPASAAERGEHEKRVGEILAGRTPAGHESTRLDERLPGFVLQRRTELGKIVL